MTPQQDDPVDRLLDAALMHVVFDGWGQATFDAAVADTGIDPALAQALCPRGAVDLAIAYHKRGDQQMVNRLRDSNLAAERFRDRVALAVRYRLEAATDKEAVRRGATLFALPQYAGDGAKLIWGTCDLIWESLGDSSQDVNWYTKRASLSAVYSSTVLYWLGDDSVDHEDTWAFLDRRIDNVMQFETLKAGLRKNPLLKPLMGLGDHIRAPRRDFADDLPGHAGARTGTRDN